MSAILCIWNNVTPGKEREYEDWYWQEHFSQRLSHPGFISGRRYFVHAGPQRYYTLFEVEAVDYVQTGAYADSLNAPSAWTVAMMRAFADVRRVIGDVTFDIGRGVGGALLAIRALNHPGWSATVRSDLSALLAERCVGTGLIRTRLLETRHGDTNVATEERRLRTTTDGTIDWSILVETDSVERAELMGVALRDEIRTRAGEECDFDVVVYRLAYWAPSIDAAREK
jgi:hypothetical protein